MRKGFSIAELIIGIFITLLLVGVSYSVFLLSTQVKMTLESRAEIVQNQRAVLDRMTRELRQANVVLTVLPAAEILFEDGHGNISSTPVQYIRYHVDAGNLYREVSHYYFTADPATHVYYNDEDEFGNPPEAAVDEDRLVGEFVTAFNFSGVDVININISFTDNNQTITLQTNVAQRNIN